MNKFVFALVLLTSSLTFGQAPTKPKTIKVKVADSDKPGSKTTEYEIPAYGKIDLSVPYQKRVELSGPILMVAEKTGADLYQVCVRLLGDFPSRLGLMTTKKVGTTVRLPMNTTDIIIVYYKVRDKKAKPVGQEFVNLRGYRLLELAVQSAWQNEKLPELKLEYEVVNKPSVRGKDGRMTLGGDYLMFKNKLKRGKNIVLIFYTNGQPYSVASLNDYYALKGQYLGPTATELLLVMQDIKNGKVTDLGQQHIVLDHRLQTKDPDKQIFAELVATRKHMAKVQKQLNTLILASMTKQQREGIIAQKVKFQTIVEGDYSGPIDGTKPVMRIKINHPFETPVYIAGVNMRVFFGNAKDITVWAKCGNMESPYRKMTGPGTVHLYIPPALTLPPGKDTILEIYAKVPDATKGMVIANCANLSSVHFLGGVATPELAGPNWSTYKK